MMRRLYVYGLRDSLRYTLVRGDLRDWLTGNGIPAMWMPRLKGWCVRTERIGDLIAQQDGYSVRMKGQVR